MAQTVDNSLETRLLAAEAGLRSLRATNLTDLASVVDASGRTVALSDMAFGQVIAEDAATIDVVGPDAGAGIGTGWLRLDDLFVDVLVGSGRLRVDVSAYLIVDIPYNATTIGTSSGGFGYAILGPTSEVAALPDAPVIRTPGPGEFVGTSTTSRVGYATITAANWGAQTGLADGWYRVEARYSKNYTASVAGDLTTVRVAGRRIAAQPY